MKAMILAAGVGERMRPLTDNTPKPLLTVAGVPLIEHHIRNLAAAGVRELVINVSHLAARVTDYCGDGERWGLRITWSREPEPLETAGGIIAALPLLGEEPFLVVNGDVWLDYPFADLLALALREDESAHLLLVDNPPQHPHGDFLLDRDGRVRVRAPGVAGLTYAGVGVYSPGFFAGAPRGKLPLRPLLDAAIARSHLGGRHFGGDWEDVGTPARLAALDARISGRRG